MKAVKTLLMTAFLAVSFMGCAHKHDHGKKKCDTKQCQMKKGKKSCCAGKKTKS